MFGDLSAPYPRVSLEALADRAPEVILDTAVDPESAEAGRAEAIRFWGRFAWSGRIEAIPRGLLTLPGPELGEAARLLRARLHDAPAGSDP